MTDLHLSKRYIWRSAAHTALLNTLIWGIACGWLYLAG